MSDEQKHGHIHFTVEEPVETTEKELSVRKILEYATVDPNTHYLIELEGCDQKEYRDLDEMVPIRECAKFIAISTGPTPTS